MKFIGTILFVSAGLLNARAADDARSVEATNTVLISTALINRLVAEARTNNPSLKAADSRVRFAKPQQLRHARPSTLGTDEGDDGNDADDDDQRAERREERHQ